MADVAYDTLPADSVIGYVRSLIPDMEQLRDPLHPELEASYLFDDVTLQRYIANARGNNAKRAAADACMALAGSELLILKKITTSDLVTDGASVAKEHRARAAQLRSEADSDDDVDEDNSGIVSAPFLRHPPQFDANRALTAGRYGGWRR